MAFDFTALNDAVLTTFGQSATHHPKTGPTQVVMAILADPFRLFDLSPDNYAAAWIPANSLTTQPVEGDGFEIGGKSYVVFNVRRDAGGGTFLALSPDAS